MENLDKVEEVIELVPEKPSVNFGKIGFAIVAAGAVAALGYKAYKLIKAKKAKGSQEAECVATVTPIEFEDEESDE
jgi:uncharacterized membrane protein YebE (DUF533 family)